MKIQTKIYYTFAMIMMAPMLRDDPKSTPQSARKMFWQGLKELWTNKLDEDLSCPDTLKRKL